MKLETLWGQETKIILLITCSCLVLFFYKLGHRPLWEYDEGMHAQVAKEMLVSGDWCTPTFNGEKFFNKPVLHFWLVLLSYCVFGVNEFAARLPSALLGMAGVFVVYAWARMLYGRINGLLSCLILATSAEYIILSQNIIHDMSLTFFVTLALFLFHRAYRTGGFSRLSLILFFCSLGLAVLAKGPIGIVLPGITLTAFFIFTRNWRFIDNQKLLLGVAIFLLVALPWYITMAVRNPDYLEVFLIKGNLARFFSGKASHQEPLYYYLPVLVVGFSPWSLFLPSTLIHHVKTYMRDKSSDTLLLLLAAVVPFLFFSLSRSKLATYILPVLPPVSILTGTFLSYGLAHREDTGWTLHFRYCCLAIFLITLASLIPGIFYINKTFSPYLLKAVLYSMLFLASALLCFYYGWRRAIYGAFTTLTIMMLLFVIVTANLVFPEVSHIKSTKELSQRINRLLAPGEPVVFYRDLRESTLFYTDRRGTILKKQEQLVSYLKSPEPVYCLMNVKYYRKLQKAIPGLMHIVDREGNFVLVSNRKPGGRERGGT